MTTLNDITVRALKMHKADGIPEDLRRVTIFRGFPESNIPKNGS